MTIETNVNVVASFVGGRIAINDLARTLIAPLNAKRIRFDVSLDCDTDTHCIELYDALTGGQLIGFLDREFTGVMIRNRDFYTMERTAIFQDDIYAIIAIGNTPYDIIVTEYLG